MRPTNMGKRETHADRLEPMWFPSAESYPQPFISLRLGVIYAVYSIDINICPRAATVLEKYRRIMY